MAGQHDYASVDVDAHAFVEGLHRALKEMHLKNEEELTRKCFEISNSAKRYCPVDTGRLRSAIGFDPEIKHDREGMYLEVGVTSARLGAPAEYATFVEFGTSKMKAQPYMRPALAEVSGFNPEPVRDAG